MRYLIYIPILFVQQASAQAIDQLGVKKGITMNGSINTSTNAYKAFGMAQRRDPFAWYLNGNINMNLFGYAMPFSFSYSNQGTQYSQPFNQYRFAPSYKWVKLYLGTTSMQFSNYTLAGHVFNGAGVELTPGKWRIAAMYGTLEKALNRKGYGTKIGYENNGNSYSIALFTAKDGIPKDATAHDDSAHDATAIDAITKNQTAAFAIKQHITKRIFADAEYSISQLNNLYYDAIQAGLGYTANSYSIQLRYERVAPDYTTLGAYTVVNDMRNVTIAPTLQFWKGKITLSGNAGLQVNNLNHQKMSDTRRWVANINTSITPNDHWTMSANYSNFNTFTRVRPLADPYFTNPLDTLGYYQVNTTYNSMLMYRIGNSAITINTSFQHASDKNDANDNLSSFFTGNLSYTYLLKKHDMSLTTAFNYYYNTSAGFNTEFFGPNLNISKQFFNKTCKVALLTTYNSTKVASTQSDLFNTGLTLGYTPKGKKHTISSSLLYMQKDAVREYTGTMNYSYSF
ncbi:hypothetical protein [[Flexibacter] sp. ATCC 35208]|uniref:hypothetical protein n=1 Tax=[Flexibacter] sp. ATCC 35208 TaxID=1936242 RepID=UPI0009D28154|nr:hypothetical protein [[Flexibacter] sp. ATCC 35208]OMP77864.1 hypothetical protein BW716_17455 [[Flexibacter] sp. ATCC 35208]